MLLNWIDLDVDRELKKLISVSDDDANNLWPEILHFMFECVQNEDVRLKDSALHIFRWVTLRVELESYPNVT